MMTSAPTAFPSMPVCPVATKYKIEAGHPYIFSNIMPRTLLPTWNEYKQHDSYTAEPFENFDWMTDDERYDYEMARKGLNTIPGSREWLKTYIATKGTPSFYEGLGSAIMSSFGPHHSGASCTYLGWMYKYALNNWDTFVQDVKRRQERHIYDNTQLTPNDVFSYKDNRDNEFQMNAEMAALRKSFNITCDDTMMKAMLDALIEEHTADYIKEQNRLEKEYYESRIEILKHHYQFPHRWNDNPGGSSLFGSLLDISPKMMAEMEAIYPGYTEHIEAMKQV